ncbi:MAG TPA: lysophospholipid acyltransferase family protein [Kineosporiaceae bacterium]|nr:lysophospholipid acyltransferase family protein [Kineosporiaceae bacterium]
MIRRRLARGIFRLTGWTMVGELPRAGIFVGAPHTSNWDFVLTLLVTWQAGLSPQILIKKEFFRGPVGWLLRLAGGIPVDRKRPAGVIEELVRQASSGESFVLVLAAEGTRKKTEYWKSGFYRIAQQTGLPILLGFVDGATKTAGIGPSLTPSGDLKADMDVIRAFYADKNGIYPAKKTEPRLREEAETSS